MTVFEAILKRSSVRSFIPYELSEQELYKMERVILKYPSAGNLRPISYHFISNDKEKKLLSQICSHQDFISESSCCVILTADYSKTTIKYGDRGIRYVLMETGHIAQNICLEAVEMGLGTCCIGAFDDKWMMREFKLREYPVYVIVIGKERK